MLNTVVVMRKRCAGVIRRVDADALDLAHELLFECFEGEQVVTKDEAVIENITVSHPVRSVGRLFRVFQQNTRLQLGPVLFANPGECEFLLAGH